MRKRISPDHIAVAKLRQVVSIREEYNLGLITWAEVMYKTIDACVPMRVYWYIPAYLRIISLPNLWRRFCGLFGFYGYVPLWERSY